MADNKDTADIDLQLADCYGTCMVTVNYCLEDDGDLADPVLIKSLLDCADICQVTSSFMFPQSNGAKRVAEVCSQVCQSCAENCDRFSADRQLSECAKVCRNCAEACRKMANMGPMPT